MLTRWFAVAAFLASSANAERVAVTVAPTCRVKGQAEVALTLNCGDGKSTGVVQYWHSPFGDIQTPGFRSKLDPVFMHHDGSLVVPNTSTHHSGLYYCLLQHAEGATLWPYELHVGQKTQKNQERSKYEQGSSCDAFRVRRDVGSEAERQAEVSHGEFAGAVAASVLLTFVLGFSAGALSRTHVLRCLGAVTEGLRSPQKCRQADRPHHGSEVIDTTPPPTYDNQAFEMEHVWDDNSANCAILEMSNSSITSSPPAKPQRSFRDKRQEEQETTVYLEGCDHVKEEERRMEGRSLQERNEGCDQETAEGRDFYLLGGGGSQTETDEEECSAEGEEKGERESTEDKKEWRQEEEIEEAGEQESRRKVEERRGSEEEKEGAERREEEEKTEGSDGEKRDEDGETDICSKHKTEVGGEPASSRPRPAPRSRVIRLYQYDDDGQRYCHLPDPAPDEPRPTPRLKQRSVSLTRLNAIMAAASAGPLDREPGREEGEERPHFHMDI